VATEESVAPHVIYMQTCNLIEQESNAEDRSERWRKCMDETDAIPLLHTAKENLVAATVETFVLLGLAWLLVYGLVGLTRWVGAGFR
jgi:hypothetical protein